MVGKSQKELMELMSPKIQGELSLQVNGTWLTRVSFLQRVELDAVVQVAMSLEPQVYVPTELLPSENLYYMCNGTVVHRGEVVLGGSVLGTDCFLQRDDLRSRPAAMWWGGTGGSWVGQGAQASKNQRTRPLPHPPSEPTPA